VACLRLRAMCGWPDRTALSRPMGPLAPLPEKGLDHFPAFAPPNSLGNIHAVIQS